MRYNISSKTDTKVPSLNATPTFEVLGLPPYSEEKKEKRAAYKAIEERTLQLTSDEIEAMIRSIKQAGSPCLTREEFLATAYVSCST